MKIGDLINREIFTKLSVNKKSNKKNSPSSTSLSIQTLLRTYNLSYERFISEIRNLNIDLPSNIYSDLPSDIFNKIAIHLEENKKATTTENPISNKEEDLYVTSLEIKEIKRLYDINPFKALQLYKDSLSRNKIKLKSNIITEKFEKLLDF